MYKITNESIKKRFCEDKLIEPGKSITSSDKKYVVSARLSPQIFKVEEIKTKNKENDE